MRSFYIRWKKLLEPVLCVVLVALGGFGLQRFCYQRTDGFALCKVLSALTPDPRWDTPPPSLAEHQLLQTLFSQPFYYLAKGAQSYVFVSEDNQAVLKLCRFDHLRAPLWFTHLVFPFSAEGYRVEQILRKRGRLEKEFESYQIAFAHLKEETGLLYLHLNKGSHWHKTLTLHDKGGVTHHLNLDELEFVVQKRASPFYETLCQWLYKGEHEKLKTALDSLVHLLYARYQEGIYDKDPDLRTNFGFLEGSAVQIDTGRFFQGQEAPWLSSWEQEAHRVTHPLQEWLQKRDPSLKTYLVNAIQGEPIR